MTEPTKFTPSMLLVARHNLAAGCRLGEVADKLNMSAVDLDRMLWKYLLVRTADMERLKTKVRPS